MGTVTINGGFGALSSPLQDMLMKNDAIVPGSGIGYQLCKQVYTYHPLGAKLAEKPLEIAQSQAREISIPKGPEDRLKEAFEEEWKKINATQYIFNVGTFARVYGISSIATLEDGVALDAPMDFTKLWDEKISFNVYDPLNTAGSLVLNQDPLSMDFQHVTDIAVMGTLLHKSRTCVMMNEMPIYIQFESSTFGFTGRSVYQRTIFPLKSYLQTLVADDMIARKSAVIVAKIKQPSSVIDNAMQFLFGTKRALLKEAENTQVLGIGPEDAIESLDLNNIDPVLPSAVARILRNIAAGARMPAKLMTDETFAEGFGEGTEDAKDVARYIDKVREWLQPLYAFFDKIVMYRAWNPEFYKTIQKDFPEYKSKPYETAFYEWKNSFVAKWPSLLIEPESEQVIKEEVKLRAALALIQVLTVDMDAANKAILVQWLVDNFNNLKFLFPGSPIDLDAAALEQWFAENEKRKRDSEDAATEAAKEGGPPTPRPFAKLDSDGVKELRESVASFLEYTNKRRGARGQREAV